MHASGQCGQCGRGQGLWLKVYPWYLPAIVIPLESLQLWYLSQLDVFSFSFHCVSSVAAFLFIFWLVLAFFLASRVCWPLIDCNLARIFNSFILHIIQNKSNLVANKNFSLHIHHSLNYPNSSKKKLSLFTTHTHTHTDILCLNAIFSISAY